MRLAQDLPRIVGNLPDAQWPRVIAYLRYVPSSWDVLNEAQKMKAQRHIVTVPAEHAAGVIADALNVADLSERAYQRIDELSSEELAEQIRRDPSKRYTDVALKRFVNSQSFRGAEMHGQSLILPLVKCLTVDQIRTALVAFQENNQIKYSWGMSAILADLLRETRPSVEAVRAEWQEIYDSVCRENREESALPLCEMLEEVFPNLNSRADEY